jgi:hypothetical protein
MKDARVPLYYWGPPLDDYAMNPSHPVYQKFMAEVWVGFGGIVALCYHSSSLHQIHSDIQCVCF